MRCDFCMADAVELPGNYSPSSQLSAQVGEVTYLDDGNWGACEECKALIDSRKFEELIARGVVGTMAMHPEVPDTEYTRDRIRRRTVLIFCAVFGEQVAE